jgi:hypothetical protein
MAQIIKANGEGKILLKILSKFLRNDDEAIDIMYEHIGRSVSLLAKVPLDKRKEMMEKINEAVISSVNQYMKKNESLEKAMNNNGYNDKSTDTIWREGVKFGAKWQGEKMGLCVQMKKEFAIKALNRIKEMNAKLNNIYELGIDIEDFLGTYTNLAEEAIAVLFTDNEKDFELCLEDVLWWLYKTDSMLITVDGAQYNVSNAEHFVEYLENNYSKK